MKTLPFYKLSLFLFLLLGMLACVNDDEFEVPNTEVIAPNINANDVIGITALNDLLLQEQTNTNNPDAVLTLLETGKYITGYVISSDEAGNFFEELLLQDAPSNPNRGVKILIDVNPLFTTFEFGRKIFVKLDGLTVGINSGVLSLGIRDGNGLGKIAEASQFDFLIRDAVVETIEPLPINISDFNDEKTNLYVRLSDVQFHRFEVGGEEPKTFAAEPTDQFDGERLLESCAEGITTTFSTSTFADFKAVLLPRGRGDLDGILSYDFFGEAYNINVNNPSTIYFESEARCDPNEITCGISETTGSNILFTDFFEDQSPGDPISGNGWTNHIEAGTQLWEAFTSTGSSPSLGISARIDSFGSGDESSVAWLITPQINFDGQEGETLNFKTSNSFADGSMLEVFFSNDWNGNPETIATATWDLLSDAYVVQDNDPFANWLSSGNVSLSCVTGNGYIAFRYVGSGEEAFDGTYEFDEIVVNSD